MGQQTFEFLLLAMSALAVIVFVALYYVRAGYGMFHTPKWGLSVNNKLGWVLMEAPVFLVMLYLWWNSSVRFDAAPFLFFLLFELHYFQRSFIFPFLMKGKSRMPLAIMLMGVVFNVLNGLMQGEWLFYLAPEGLYTDAWRSVLWKPSGFYEENEEKTYGKVRDRRLESHHWGRIYKGKHTKAGAGHMP